MNAESYLRKQGWKGSGHSLDTTGRGIKKPLLIAHKQDQLGLGKKKAAWTTDDQWWMRAFDESLQSIGTGQESTLNQIRTKGINRGGLYGFFVKGEAIAGTMEDSSASATDASAPPSRASTPPTSASESEAAAKTANMSDKKSKRKRVDRDASKVVKKAKKDHSSRDKSSSSDSATVDRKIAKLSPKKRAMYEARAATKQQSLNEYIARRIEKKCEKRATRYDEPAPEALFFADLEGDATLPQQVHTIVPTQPILGVTAASDDIPIASATEPEGPDAAAIVGTGAEASKKKLKRDKRKPSAGAKAMKQALREKRKEKKTARQASKAGKKEKPASKWGANKENSRWGKIKARKVAERKGQANNPNAISLGERGGGGDA